MPVAIIFSAGECSRTLVSGAGLVLVLGGESGECRNKMTQVCTPSVSGAGLTQIGYHPESKSKGKKTKIYYNPGSLHGR